jgi:predicted PurR-regulated permease PerM
LHRIWNSFVRVRSSIASGRGKRLSLPANHRIFDPITRFLKKHGSQLIAAVFFIVGIFLIARGVTSAMML